MPGLLAVRTYELILHEQAWAALAATKGATRRRLLALRDLVKTNYSVAVTSATRRERA